ncbi:MAG: hypothetical protein KC910_14010 [Candidatus Eremiobacteraeota bacterium]|nr:hypothetical protein [Candidatus Eremiobacteraeota bacterium]
MSRWTPFFTLLLAGLTLAGCSNPAPPAATPTPAAVVKDQSYDHRQLPEKVEEMSGTALLSCSGELAAHINAPDDNGSGFFVLISTSTPDKGVLVRAGNNLTPEELMTKKSTIVAVSGPVKTLDNAELAPWFTKEFGLELSQVDGKVQWVDNQQPLELESAEEKKE